MPRRYSEHELADFEAAMGIVLPDAYRRYMRDHGAALKLSALEEWCQPNSPADLPPDFLAQPFPHGSPWNDRALFKKEEGWQSAYFDEMLFRGSMRIANLGCEAYDLLVVSGTERGNIWCDERASAGTGIYPRTGPNGDRLRIEEYLRP
jgi:hypothetical protein